MYTPTISPDNAVTPEMRRKVLEACGYGAIETDDAWILEHKGQTQYPDDPWFDSEHAAYESVTLDPADLPLLVELCGDELNTLRG